jgi:ankyrin repeat protein
MVGEELFCVLRSVSKLWKADINAYEEAHQRRVHMSERSFKVAIQCGGTELIEWLGSYSCPIDQKDFQLAVDLNRVDQLKWFYVNGYVDYKDTSSFRLEELIRNNHMETWDWLVHRAGRRSLSVDNYRLIGYYNRKDMVIHPTIYFHHCVGAAKGGHPDFLDFINAKTPIIFSTPSEFICRAAHVSTLEWFVSKGADPKEDHLDYKPAIEEGDLDALQWIHRHQPCLLNTLNTALSFAIRKKQRHIVEWLLDTFECVNDIDAPTAAVEYGDVDLLARVLERIPNPIGTHMMVAAVSTKNMEMIQLVHHLVDEYIEQNVFVRIMINGGIDVFDWFVTHHDISSWDELNEYLVYALEMNHFDIVKSLCDYPNVVITDDELHVAIHSGNTEMFAYLLERARTISAAIPMEAARLGRASMFKMTLKWLSSDALLSLYNCDNVNVLKVLHQHVSKKNDSWRVHALKVNDENLLKPRHLQRWFTFILFSRDAASRD